MNKEEWSQVENALKRLFGSVKLEIDGYMISIALLRVSTYKNAIVIYVNDVFKGQWLFEDCEERRRFLPKKERSLLTAKDKAGWKKLPKKMQRELAEKYDTKHEYYLSHWTSFSALKKHLIANNESIKLIEIK